MLVNRANRKQVDSEAVLSVSIARGETGLCLATSSLRFLKQVDVIKRLVTRLLAQSSGISERAILSGRRGRSDTVRARQLAMYLVHTSFSLPYAVVGEAFRRDRTTVTYACRTIEDLRDDPAEDHRISRLEDTLSLVTEMLRADPGATNKRTGSDGR